MSNILKSTFGKAATILSIAGLAVVAVGASAEAGPYHHGWDRGHHWEHPYRWDHARWYGGGYYAPRYYAPQYYAAPPVVTYPPAYYGPPSINFNIPLG
jgi:hypothetical protein